MIKGTTDPYHSSSRAVILVREWAKRRQRRMRVGLLSAENYVIQSAEAFHVAEGNTARTVLVRCEGALRRRRTHTRMYVQGRDLGGLHSARCRDGPQGEGACSEA